MAPSENPWTIYLASQLQPNAAYNLVHVACMFVGVRDAEAEVLQKPCVKHGFYPKATIVQMQGVPSDTIAIQ